MMRTMPASVPDRDAVRVTLHLEPGFVATEAAAVQDVLRIANRLSGREVFRLTATTSCGGELVESLSGSLMRAGPLHWERPAHLVMAGGQGVAAAFPRLLPAIGRARAGGAHCLFLSDAAAEWACRGSGLSPVTTHWENSGCLRETRPGLQLQDGLYSCEAAVTTSAGMAATADVVLDRIVTPVSAALAGAVSRSMVMEGIRDGGTPQRVFEADAPGAGRASLARIIRRMEENIEQPIRLTDLAGEAGLSIRQVERNFKRLTGRTPAGYYRWLRLRKGKLLLEQTDMSVLDIAVSCGFASNCNFSRVFQREFGQRPSQLRRAAQHSA